jgi:hypothetical protein
MTRVFSGTLLRERFAQKNNLVCLRPFGIVDHFELYCIALVDIRISIRNDRTVMDEDVNSHIYSDKAKSLRFVEPSDSSGFSIHNRHLLLVYQHTSKSKCVSVLASCGVARCECPCLSDQYGPAIRVGTVG